MQILLGSTDAELSTRDIAEQLNVNQSTVVRRIQRARQVWKQTRRREIARDVMYALLTLAAVTAAVSLAIIAARYRPGS